MAEALLEMTGKRFGCVGVVDGGGRLVGIVTDGDLRRHMAPDLLERPVASVMTPRPRTIDRRALAAEALAVMNGGSRPVTSLFVVEDGGRSACPARARLPQGRHRLRPFMAHPEPSRAGS